MCVTGLVFVKDLPNATKENVLGVAESTVSHR